MKNNWEKPIFLEELISPKNVFLLSFMLLEAAFTVIQKRLSITMVHYPYTLTLSQPICTTILFGICSLISEYKEKKSKLKRVITEEEEEKIEFEVFPLYKYAILGILFTITNFCMFSGSRGNIVPGTLVVILKQSSIPISIIISAIFLKKRFCVQHYVGSLIILGGIILSLSPDFKNLNQSGPFWAIILILTGSFTISIAAIYMEYGLKRFRLQIYKMWAWVNFFEILFALPLVLGIVPIQGLSFSEIPNNVADGYDCLLMGHNSLKGDSCFDIGYLFIIFILVIIVNKSNQAYIIKNNSNTLMWIASTCAVPLSTIAFTLTFIMGNAATQLDWEMIVGLIIVCIGLVIYKSTKEIILKKEENNSYEKLIT